MLGSGSEAARQVMRTILRKTENGMYFEGPDKWTGDPRLAFNFKSIDRALRFIERFHLRNIEIAFAFNDRPDVTGVPLDRMVLRYSEEG
jgi:hypothetical protein